MTENLRTNAVDRRPAAFGRSTNRRGAMLPLIAALLPILLIFLGFAVDLAYMQTTRMELQAAADCAARAGATQLAQSDNPADARTAARNIALLNQVAGAPLQLSNSEIQVGRSTRNAAGRWVFANGGSPANSVSVTANRTTGSRNGPVPLFFGALIGTPSFQPVQQATATFLNIDICLVLDRSTSMKQGVSEGGSLYTTDARFCRAPNSASRWMGLDAAVRIFISELDSTDASEQVALATYSCDGCGFSKHDCGISNEAASLDCSLSTDLKHVTKALDRLTTSVWNGHTFIEAGMKKGLAALQDKKLARLSAEKVMIVLTDGRQNVGNAENSAHDCAEAGVTVHTITFSDVAEQSTMKRVASIAGGQHYHAPDTATLKKIFRALAAQTSLLTE